MSGGVDSSATAALLKAAGLDVVGATLRLYDARNVGASRSCCAGRDIADARQVANQLGIPHYVLDYEALFHKNVIADFAATYAAGATPVPCIRCNQRVKFADFLDFSRDIGAEALVTGHYVRRVVGSRGVELHRGVEPNRDQSYFLFATTRPQLERLRFPLGGMSKDETRRIAASAGLAVAEKPDSQDICFVPDGDYAAIVGKLRPEAMAPGEIVDGRGRVLGRHEGLGRFTVGQRRGLGVGGGEPYYVRSIDPLARRVTVGRREELGAKRFTITEINWLGDDAQLPASDHAVTVKVRSTQPGRPAVIRAKDPDRLVIALNEAEAAVAPGQAAVLYDGDRVLGGGVIERQ